MEKLKILIKNIQKTNFKYFTSNSKHSINILKFQEIPDLKYFLTDSHARMHNYLRISLTERCNLRCQV